MILFQLPPGWRRSPRRLGAFLDELPEGPRIAFELPEPSWHVDEIFELLERRGAGTCIHDLGGAATPLVTTSSFVHVRLSGPPAAHTGHYPAGRLRLWTGRATGWNRDGKDVFVVFDDRERDYALRNARRAQASLREEALA